MNLYGPTVRYECPFTTCTWHYDQGPLKEGEPVALLNEVAVERRDLTLPEVIQEAVHRVMQRAEDACENHFLTVHGLAREDAIATIRAMRQADIDQNDFGIPVAPI